MTYDELTRIDPNFVHDLAESQRFVWYAAQYLAQRGRHVTVRAPSPNPVHSYADLELETDSGDLELHERVEVKHRKLHFTSAEDYPYPTVIVNVCRLADRKPEALLHWIWNEDATAAIVIPRSSRRHWIRTRRSDSNCNRTREYYECPIAFARFIQVDSSRLAGGDPRGAKGS